MTAHRPISLAPHGPATPQADHTRRLINAAFCGKLEPQDMVHMARALLQLSDEMAEMRERMRAMEIRIGAI